MTELYTTQLGAGLGIIAETHLLLDIWREEMDPVDLYHHALDSGLFPNVSARRLRNLVMEGFSPRYLSYCGKPARLLKLAMPGLSNREVEQLLFIYTCRAQKILADFVRQIYWHTYASGRETLSNEEVRGWVTRASQDGKTTSPWSYNMIERVAGYLTRCCADFGLLEKGIKQQRAIQPYWIEPRVAAFLAYELHLAGQGDNRLIGHPDWSLFGLERQDVLDVLKDLALKGFLILQTAGEVSRIGWHYSSMEEVIRVLAER